MTAGPIFNRMRLDTVRRTVTVLDIVPITPGMLRVVFGGQELEGFNSPSPDDHIKLFFPVEAEQTEMRDYTPRRFDPQALTLAVDFALHTGGVGSDWAKQAKKGDTLQIGGPRGSTVITADGAWWMLIGDETALPSIARRLEELPAESQVRTFVSIPSSEEAQRFETRVHLEPHWVVREGARDSGAEALCEAIGRTPLQTGPGIIWIGAEDEVAKRVRSYVVDRLGHPAEWVKASAYWKRAE